MPHYIDTFLSPVRDNPIAQKLVAALLIAIVLDVFFGLLGAILNREVESSKMRKGLQHKLGELGLLCAADLIDGLLAGGLDLGIAPVLISTATFLVLMEIFSICENCIKMNPDFVDIPFIGTLAKLLNDAKGGNVEQQQVGDQDDSKPEHLRS